MRTSPRFRKLFEVAVIAVIGSLAASAAEAAPAKRAMEKLDRGLVAMQGKNGVFLSWRLFGTDPKDVAFDLHRDGKKINRVPLVGVTNHLDPDGVPESRYHVAVAGGAVDPRKTVAVWPRKSPTSEDAKKARHPALPWLEIPLDPPGEKYVPGDMTVGDLDGDGRYELVFLWEGSSPQVEAVDLDGESRWRIALGPNVTTNAVPLLVYDLDGDGKAEFACVTAIGTRDASGEYLKLGPAADVDHTRVLKRGRGLVEDGSFITVFDGATGRERVTIPFWPPIGPREAQKDVWGDADGHRANSIKGAILHHGEHGPLLVFSRGIYSRVAMKAYAFDGAALRAVWTFDSKDPEHPEYLGYRGQGNHSLAVGDVDGDGHDELIYGACAIDDDGKGLYTTRWGHGDSHALAKHMPDRPGLQFYQGHESGQWGVTMRDAATGEMIWGIKSGSDVGRAWAADVSANHRGSESSSIIKPKREPSGEDPTPFKHQNLDAEGREIPTSYNAFSQPVWFGGTLQRALRNQTVIDGPEGRLLAAWPFGAATIHASKHDACLVADILGDWREEIVFRRGDNKALLIFSTWIPTEHNIPTLMHDPLYRMNVAVQNVGYNQPAHPGYYLPDHQ